MRSKKHFRFIIIQFLKMNNEQLLKKGNHRAWIKLQGPPYLLDRLSKNVTNHPVIQFFDKD